MNRTILIMAAGSGGHIFPGLAIAKELADEGRGRVAWARFDFRGVGNSEGTYDGGHGEVDDARAVIEHVMRAAPGAPISVCGHSFGSWVGLRAASGAPGVDRVLLVAPSIRFFSFEREATRFDGHKTIFIGTEDPFCDVGEAQRLAADLGAELKVFDGFDHHFMKSRRAMAKAALPVVAPEALNP